ncbi:hypothetical protein [Natronolimnobius baerhuensis]|uniref:hypothetical protein n=1 Tax=Natronolimnobius baerhuensis TaxID=253108 RepID=UPI001594FEE6|nr:hypothetical protein [Natronolimnobius baerhuensis]
MSDTRYDEGEVVATPDGRGVVAAVLTDGLGEGRANAHWSAMKDEMVRTERWRNRF